MSSSFFSGGKNYAYLDSQGNTVVKVRGFTISSGASQKLNFDSIKSVVLNTLQPNVHSIDKERFPFVTTLGEYKAQKRPAENSTQHTQSKCRKTDDVPVIAVTEPTKICRDKFKFKVQTKSQTKLWKMVFDKRFLPQESLQDGSLISYPYGYLLQ